MLPPHTKKHLGTGLVGLEEIHICPVQAIGIQSFTLSNATKREKRNRELALHFTPSREEHCSLLVFKAEGINRFLFWFDPVQHTSASNLGNQVALLPGFKITNPCLWVVASVPSAVQQGPRFQVPLGVVVYSHTQAWVPSAPKPLAKYSPPHLQWGGHETFSALT